MSTLYTTYESPIGPLLLTSDGTFLTGLYMNEHVHGPTIREDWEANDAAIPFAETRAQLQDYFAGSRTTFDLPLRASGTTFQNRVWEELAQIPYGIMISYGELARRIGNPSASRAVGLANGQNPISIIVPCHRVIGANGKLTGYGGGMERKKFLLAHEGKSGVGVRGDAASSAGSLRLEFPSETGDDSMTPLFPVPAGNTSASLPAEDAASPRSRF